MKNYTHETRPWLIWLTVIAVILAGVGIFFYYNFFRQSKSELIEAIPTDAAFIFTLNDNDGFVSGTREVTPYLNEIFAMDALPAYETMRGKLPAGEYDLTVSGHVQDNAVSLLFNTHADKAAFRRLLRALSIDPNNYTAFENNRIYTYGTNYKSVKFVYTNHIISFSTDLELLKRAIVQHSHPKNLLSDKEFKEMYRLSEKNQKQNWLIINTKSYIPYLSTFLNGEASKALAECLNPIGWTALQLRFSGNGMYLSGYTLVSQPEDSRYDFFIQRNGNGSEINSLFPARSDWYVQLETPKLRENNKVKTLQHAEHFVELNPSEVGYFSFRTDSCSRRFAILLPDSSKNAMEVFFGNEASADSARNAHPDGFFSIPSPLSPLLTTFAPDSATWFIEKDNALVFADSKEALKAYQSSMKAVGNLTQNRLYPFVNEAVASSSLLNFVIFNEEGNAFWAERLSDKGTASHFGKDLRIFSVSCDAMERDSHLLPINLYLHF